MSAPIPRRDFLTTAALAAGSLYLRPSLAAAKPRELGRNRHYASNRDPLLATPYTALPLGSIKPLGWLRTQLELQRDGLTGHAEELLPALKADSGWLGGEGEDWEKGPYYVKGLIPLAYALEDDTLKKKAQKWIDWMLSSQREDGFFGPRKNDDWWPRMVVTYLLRDHHEATGDPRVLPFLTKYYAHMTAALPERPLRDWGKARAGDEIDTVLWLYNRTGDAALLKTAEVLHQQANDWSGILTENRFLFELGTQKGSEKVAHNVNVPQALKTPPVVWQQTHEAADRDALQVGLRHLAADHGLAVGIEAGTEHLSGRSTTQGIETCSTVEKMLSLETALRILGDATLGDDLERLAFNALPGALSAGIKQLVYYTRPNNVTARLKPSGFWQDYADGSVPSPIPGYPCCCYNFHMGWPKYLQNAWAATHDGGLAVLAYGPSQVKAKVGDGAEVTITQTTGYPFEALITLKIETAKPVAFPLELRVPGWCQGPRIRVGKENVEGLQPGTFARIDRTWSNGEEVTIQFPARIRATKGMNASAILEWGALVFALQIREERKITKPAPDGFDQYELTPASPWNYALALDWQNLESVVAVNRRPLGQNPFASEEVPVRLTVRGRRLPDWQMAWNEAVAFDPPVSPVASAEPEEELTLVPFGSQYLRVTNFPVLGTPEPPAREFHDNFDQPHAPAWVAYRGGWYVKEGQFGCDGGQPGGKAVATATHFTDLTCETQVAIGEVGHGGLLLRASKFGAGIDDFAGYYIALYPEAGCVLAGKSNGHWQEIARAPLKLEAHKLYTLRVEARGPKMQVFVDDAPRPMLEFSDADFPAGAIGLRHHLPKRETAFIRFDNVSAKAI